MPVAMSRIGAVPFADGTDAYTLHVFRVDAWTDDPVLADDEHSELRWFTVEAASSLPDLAAKEYVELFRGLQA